MFSCQLPEYVHFIITKILLTYQQESTKQCMLTKGKVSVILITSGFSEMVSNVTQSTTTKV